MTSPAYPLTIFYDRSCGLCASEMHALKANDLDGNLLLVDCSSPAFDSTVATAAGISREQLLRIIHAKDASGRWWRGVDVIQAAYAAGGMERLAWLWGHPRLRPIWDRLYPCVARYRLQLTKLGLGWLVGLVVRGFGVAKLDRASRPGTPCSVGACSRTDPG